MMIYAAGGLIALMAVSLATLIATNVFRRRRMHALAGIADKAHLRFAADDDSCPTSLAVLQLPPMSEGHDLRIQHSASGRRRGTELRLLDVCMERGSFLHCLRGQYAIAGAKVNLPGRARVSNEQRGEATRTGDVSKVVALQCVLEAILDGENLPSTGAILYDGWVWVYGLGSDRKLPEWLSTRTLDRIIEATKHPSDRVTE